MIIDNFKIGEKSTYIIAEIGNNHNGDFDRAIQMIDDLNSIDVNAVKFQKRDLSSVYTKKSLSRASQDLNVEYTLDLLRKFELNKNQHQKLKKYCLQKNITYLCTPWDINSFNFLEKINVAAYKISSADFTNIFLIENVIKSRKPIILSTGMATEVEIKLITNFLKKKKIDFALLHCNSTYPAPLNDINLKWIKKLKTFSKIVGYSGHERDIYVSLAAVGVGASIIERHFTLDRNMEGPDHAASLELENFKSMVKGIREIDVALGNENKKYISQGEMINKENLSKSIVAKKDLKKGDFIKMEDLDFKSPGQGLPVYEYKKLIGKKISRDINKDDFFYKSDILRKKIKPENFNFNNKWGIPVRYHDINFFSKISKPDLWEFHLSYSDMKIDINTIFKKKLDTQFLVHAPELFEESLLMDLASTDDMIREKSINETQKVIDITRELNFYFPNTISPKIICNIGGYSMDKNFSLSEKRQRYELFIDSYNLLDKKNVEILPQTMAPFPWHFGGQRYQNLFVIDDEIDFYCSKFNLNICLDISHSWLACNHLNKDFYKFCKKISRYTKHIHVGDAFGTNGEGLQIDNGEIDFMKLGKLMNTDFKKATFIPEIWQGHKNGGEGFWIALKKLEKYFK